MREVETIISEAGIDLESELMEEVEHVSEDSDSEEKEEEEERHVASDSVEEGKIETSELEEHEIRHKRPSARAITATSPAPHRRTRNVSKRNARQLRRFYWIWNAPRYRRNTPRTL